MDPVRGMIHLGLKVTETTLSRVVDVVRLADTLLVASALPPVRDRGASPSPWPEEEQADLDALGAALRAKESDPKAPVKKAPVKKAPVKKAPVKKTPVKKTPVKKTPVKKTSVKKTSTPAVLPDA